MSYKHILVAVDLSEESLLLAEKAAGLAKALNGKLSVIHIDVVQDDGFARQIVKSLVEESDSDNVLKASYKELTELTDKISYPIEEALIGYGGLTDELEDAIEEYGIDLIVCGHHQNFWHSVSSTTKQMLKTIPVDLLVIPLK